MVIINNKEKFDFKASFLRRAIAITIDFVLCFYLSKGIFEFMRIFNLTLIVPIFIAVIALYHFVLCLKFSTTIGNKLLRLHFLDQNQSSLNLKSAIKRVVAILVSLTPLIISYLIRHNELLVSMICSGEKTSVGWSLCATLAVIIFIGFIFSIILFIILNIVTVRNNINLSYYDRLANGFTVYISQKN
jgi:hypothetical protein